VILWRGAVAGVHRDTGRVVELRDGIIHDPLEDPLPQPAGVPADDSPTLQGAT
jgi:hypothetical protein